MEKDKLNRLSHWWREVESASDEEALQRKLHLMEAEIRNTLRGAHAAGKHQVIRNFYAAGLLCVVLLLALGIVRLVPTTSAIQYATTEAGERLPAAAEPVIVAEPLQQPSMVEPEPVAPSASTHKTAPVITGVKHKRSQAVTRRNEPPAAKPQAPASIPASVAPARTAPEPATAGAKTEPEPGLDALALLSRLESEFEK